MKFPCPSPQPSISTIDNGTGLAISLLVRPCVGSLSLASQVKFIKTLRGTTSLAWRVKKKKIYTKKIYINEKHTYTQGRKAQETDIVFTKGKRQRRHTVTLFTVKIEYNSKG